MKICKSSSFRNFVLNDGYVRFSIWYFDFFTIALFAKNLMQMDEFMEDVVIEALYLWSRA